MNLQSLLRPLICLSFVGLNLSASVATAAWNAGAAKVNISPSYPVRLSGYGSRTTEHEGVKVEIWAKALAIAWDNEPPAVVITVDNCGVPASLRAEVLAALANDKVQSDRFAVCSTHTHCAPMLNGMLKNIFGTDLPADQQSRVDRYTNELRDWLVQAAREAIANMEPATLHAGKGEVKFAGNRRYKSPEGFLNSPNPEGPTDHDLPVLKVIDTKGAVRAVFTSYACHCTTMNWNYVHPDWAGIAQLHLEMAYPKAVALTAIGCGADQNPYPRREENMVRIHGYDLAKAAIRVVSDQPMRPLSGPLECRVRNIKLAYDTLPTGDELAQKASHGKSLHDRYFGQHFLGMLKRGESLPTELPYMVQAWRFGADLAMVFLNGEVVVDYGLRLKTEFDRNRMWVNSYSNDVPCYIPSERVLKEGGYEGGGAMTYYLRPAKFAPGLEDMIIGAVKELVPATFKSQAQTAGSRK
jgi:hypothetical protein